MPGCWLCPARQRARPPVRLAREPGTPLTRPRVPPAQVYLVPYLVVNASLVSITLLQHTHPGLPHYTTETWDWLRGALATVDRSFGFLDHFHHHIADTHVLHHLFSTIPHYHAQVGPPQAPAPIGLAGLHVNQCCPCRRLQPNLMHPAQHDARLCWPAGLPRSCPVHRRRLRRSSQSWESTTTTIRATW